MAEKKSIKVGFGTTVCVFLIFFLVLGMVAMYYFGFVKNNRIINTLENEKGKLYQQLNVIYEGKNKENTTNEIVNNQSAITLLDINNKEVKKLYNYILKFNYYDELLVYQENKVTYNNIDNKLKLLTIFENLDESQAQKVKSDTYTGAVESDGNSYKYLYTKDIVEAKAKEIFGENATVIHENCSPCDGYSRIYEDGVYTCFDYAGGGEVPWLNSKNLLLKAETDGDNIYLYDTYIHLVEDTGTGQYGTFDIYATSDRKISIASKINLEKEGVYEGTENLSGDAFNSKYISNLLNIINNKNKTFKHTFSKDTNGNYYWVSTEIVD